MLAERKPKAAQPPRSPARQRAGCRARRRRPSPLGGRRAGHGGARPRLGGRRGDHELHEHVEPERDDRRGAARAERRQARAQGEAVGEDQPRARLAGRHGVSARRRGCSSISPSSASTSSATAARPASATAVRCPSRCRRIVKDRNLVVASVLSGNRNFEGRIQSQVRANYLASPPLVVAYALAGQDADRPDDASRSAPTPPAQPVYLQGHLADRARDPGDDAELGQVGDVPRASTPHVFDGDERWRSLPVPTGERFEWTDDSTYIRNPPFFEGMTREPAPPTDITRRARAGGARRQRHDRSHFAGRLDPGRQPGREVPDRQGRAAARLQLVRRASRQPRSDDARHVREHPPAQSARAWHRRRLDDAPAARTR